MRITQQRREREIIEMRRLIVEAAVDLYLEHGYEKLSLRSIAQRIQYSVGTIYLYFKNKDELFFAMHEWAFNKMFGIFSALTQEKNPAVRLWRLGETYIQFAYDNPQLYDLMFILNEPMCVQEDSGDWLCGHQSYAFLRDMVKECIEKGYMAEGNIDQMSFLIFSMVHGMVSLKLRNRLRLYDHYNIEDKDAFMLHSMDLMYQNLLTEKGKMAMSQIKKQENKK